jgi:hypothetical protein
MTDFGSTMTGKMSSATFYNFALAQADVTEIYELDGGVPERLKFGSQTDPTAALSFVVGVSASGTFSSGSSTGFTFSDAATEPSQIWRRPTVIAAPILSGRQFQLSFNATLTSGQSPTVLLKDASGTNAFAGSVVVAGANTILITNTIPLGGFSYLPLFSTTAPTSYAISGLLLKQLGAVAHFSCDDGFGLQLKDASTNKLHATITPAGVTHVVAKNSTWVRFTTSTSGNELAMGASALLPATCWIRQAFARARTNTPSYTLGTASGGTQIVASTALSTTWKQLTIVQTAGTNIAAGAVVTANSPIYGGSSSVDVVEVMIEIVALTV